MATLVEGLLPVLVGVRSLVADLGLRRYTVTVRTVTWDSGEVGVGNPTESDLTLTPNPKVQEVDDRTIKVSHITPAFDGPPPGGYSMDQLRPPTGPDYPGVEFFYVVTGPNGSINYALTAIDMSDGAARGEGSGSFRYTLTLESLNRAGPQ